MKVPVKLIISLLPALYRRAKWRAKNPGPVDIAPTRKPKKTSAPPAPAPVETPTDPTMKFSTRGVIALITGLVALLMSPDVAPMLPEAWPKALAFVSTVVAVFAPKLVERK